MVARIDGPEEVPVNKKQLREQRKAAAAPQIEEEGGESATTKSGLPKLPALPRMRKPKAGKECECGCGEMTKGGRFLPGHDSYLKGLALRIERKVIKYADIENEGQRKAVMRLMKAGGAASMSRQQDTETDNTEA